MARFALYLMLTLWPGLAVIVGPAHGSDLPPCFERVGGVVVQARVEPRRWCLERIIHDPDAGELAFTALAAAPDGTLYAARPLQGQVLALRDTDADALPDTIEIAAEGLTTPNALTYGADGLYIAGGNTLHRLTADGELVQLADNIPAGPGTWTGGLAVDADGDIYVGTGAVCANCPTEDSARGAILRYPADGGAYRVVAVGLHNPAGLAFHDGELWVTDIAPDGSGLPDEINRVQPGAHYGFPHCDGSGGRRTAAGLRAADFDCEQAVPPALTLPAGSHPRALLSYTAGTFCFLTGKLVAALAGSTHQAAVPGYQLIGVEAADRGRLRVETLAPVDRSIAPEDPQTLPPGALYRSRAAAFLNQRGAGFWPDRIYGMAQSAEGWLYISTGDARIYTLRPGDYDPCTGS